MPSWGANTNDESKPKWLTEEQKAKTFATERGWEYLGDNGVPEVLVAIRGLAGGTTTSNVKLGEATITAVYFGAVSYSTGATGTVRVVWNEKVSPTTTGTLLVTRSDTSATITATRVGAGGNNYVDFSFTAPSATGVTLSITSQTISMGINDLGSTTVTSDLIIALTDVKNAAAKASGSTSVTTTA